MGIDVDKLTLAEIEAIAERLDAAVRTFREAREMLGGAVVGPSVSSPPLARAGHAPPLLTPEEQAHKEALLRRNRSEDLPADIRRAEGLS